MMKHALSKEKVLLISMLIITFLLVLVSGVSHAWFTDKNSYETEPSTMGNVDILLTDTQINQQGKRVDFEIYNKSNIDIFLRANVTPSITSQKELFTFDMSDIRIQTDANSPWKVESKTVGKHNARADYLIYVDDNGNYKPINEKVIKGSFTYTVPDGLLPEDCELNFYVLPEAIQGTQKALDYLKDDANMVPTW